MDEFIFRECSAWNVHKQPSLLSTVYSNRDANNESIFALNDNNIIKNSITYGVKG